MKRWLAVSLISIAIACGDGKEVGPDGPAAPPCSDHQDNDGDGLTDFPDDQGCASSVDDTEDSLAAPACSDHRDNDHDGKLDYPDDPGCPIPQADDELDDCPSGPNCPQCSNGRDDDASGGRDFPGDPGCASAADPIEFVESPTACGATLAIVPLPATGIDARTLDATSTSSIGSPCGGAAGAPAIAYLMPLTSPTVVVISTAGSTLDTLVELRAAACLPADAHIACNDNVGGTDTSSKLTRSLPAGAYYLIVAAKTPGTTAAYNLRVDRFAGEGSPCVDRTQCGPGLVCRVPANAALKVCTEPVCSDGLDDDADGKIDYPADPGCTTPSDPDELDDCPGGPGCPACGDGLDNDGDAAADYPMDASCTAAGDASEACITSEPIGAITGPLTTGDTTGATNDYDPTCNAPTGESPDLVYRIDLPAVSTLRLNVTGFNTVTTLLDPSCGGAPIRCSDPAQLTVANLGAGTYYVTVEGASTADRGPFSIITSGTIAPFGSCEGELYRSGALGCPVGFRCDGPVGARTCRTECSDAIDNNGDGTTDYPDDPGCSTAADDAETTVCPGPACPACSDGLDNDGDVAIDYPMDPSCSAAGAISEECTTSEPIGTIVGPTTMGATTGQVNDATPVCGSATHSAPDLVYRIDLPAMQLLNLNLAGFDGAHSLFDASCGGVPIACSNPPLMSVGNLAAGTYYVAVDGWNAGSGAFTLTTSGTIAPGGSCEGGLFAAGAISCAPGLACGGPTGARTCRAECSDGVDNNGDGNADYPDDPGCAAPSDDTEATVCPGAACPACSDGVDNDGDAAIDYPDDPSCAAAGATTEACMTSEPIVAIAGTTTIGNTIGQINDYKPVCGNVANHTAPDLLYQLDVPALQSLTLNLTGFDGAHALLDATCGGAPVACSDPQIMTVTDLAAGRYYVAIDGYSTASGPFTLLTSGVVAPGGSCEGALFAAGTLTCPTGLTCKGPAGARTCRSQCSDGIDNNGDGKIDFPDDPSCGSLIDNTEVDVCPGPACPACGNASDDDGDEMVDFPADVGCASASGTTEVFCGIEPDFHGLITAPVTTGTLASPAANSYHQTCQANTGNDVVYALALPVAVRDLVISTAGSTIADTVVSVKDSACGAQLGCDDDGDPAGDLSLLTLHQVAPGNYAIQVDAYNANGANNGPFQLTVRGTVAPGTRCSAPLFDAGVLACPTGTSCTAGICQ